MTSAISVPAGVGIPVTQRGMVHGFTVVSGHLPPGHEKSLLDWNTLAQSGATLSIIMGFKNARVIAEGIARRWACWVDSVRDHPGRHIGYTAGISL